MNELCFPKYFIYLAIDSAGQSKINISSNPRVDAYFLSQYGYHEMYIVQPPQPIWVAEIVLIKLSQISSLLSPTKFQKLSSSLIKELYPLKQLTIQRHDISELSLQEFELSDIGSLLWGRSLLGTEIPELIKSNGIDLPGPLKTGCNTYICNPKIQREAASNYRYSGAAFLQAMWGK